MYKKNILILAPYTSLPNETGFNRFLYLAYLLADFYNVTLLTSSFRHSTKKQRDIVFFEKLESPFTIKLINEPGYKKNVGIGRLFSHYKLLKNIEDWLKEQKTGHFNLVYSAFPLISTNLLLEKYKAKLNYKIIIDVQDIWPDSISAVFPLTRKINFLLSPIRRRAEKVYQLADGIVAVSQTYLDIAKKVNPNVPALSVYIGADKSLVDSIKPETKELHKTKLLYIGTLSYSYDIKTVIYAVNKLYQTNPYTELHIFGDGPDLNRLKKIAKSNIYFHGLKPYSEMISFAKSCDILVNPIVASAQPSITNKLSDYFLLKLPIINSQKLYEVKQLIELTNGVNYEAGSVKSFIESLQHLLQKGINKTTNCQYLIDDLFDRKTTYNKILHLIEEIL